MRTRRTAAAAKLLVVEAGLAGLAVLVHYSTLIRYGDVTDSALEGLRWGFSVGVGWKALALVGVAALVAVLVSLEVWMRLVAVAIPVLMVVGMLAVTPAGLGEKRERCDAEQRIMPPPAMTQDFRRFYRCRYRA